MSTGLAASCAPVNPSTALDAFGPVVIATINRDWGHTGVHTHTTALIDGLRREGIGCELVTPFPGSSRWLPVFAARKLFIRPLSRTASIWWYRRWHRAALQENLIASVSKRSPAAIVAQCPLSAAAALEARSRCGRNLPVLMVCHFNHSEATEYREQGELAAGRCFEQILALEKRVMEAVDGVIFVSDWARQVVEARGIRPRWSQVIWNGLPQFNSTPRLRRAELGLSDDDLVIINVGTMEPRKNQLALVELFSGIALEFPQAKLLLVGDGPERQRVAGRVAALGLEPRVRLLGFRKDVPDLLSLADVYVHTARAENCPLVLIEAARAGLASAAIPAGGVPELLRALGGISLPDEGPEAMLASLRPLLSDGAHRRRCGRGALQAFNEHFTADVMVSRYVDALRSIGAPVEAVRFGGVRS